MEEGHPEYGRDDPDGRGGEEDGEPEGEEVHWVPFIVEQFAAGRCPSARAVRSFPFAIRHAALTAQLVWASPNRSGTYGQASRSRCRRWSERLNALQNVVCWYLARVCGARHTK